MILRINKPFAGQIFHIDQSGHMPVLRCEAVLLDDQEQPVKSSMQWLLEIHDNIWPARCPSAKIGRQVVRLQGASVGMGVWSPAFDAPCGGDARLTVSSQWEGQTYSANVPFGIRGRNPAPDAVLKQLGGETSPLAQLAYHVSALRQFDVQGLPLVGKDGAVGMLQLCDPAASSHQRWSWVHNVQAGKALFQRLEGQSRAYLDRHRSGHGIIQYLNDQDLSDGEVLLREILQRFLGGAYWRRDEQAGLWCADPPDDAVDTLLGLRHVEPG